MKKQFLFLLLILIMCNQVYSIQKDLLNKPIRAESPDGHLIYEGQPGFEFIKEIPTVWDKTKVLDAKISEYIIFAREKNEEWYIGSITNESRDETVSFSFLPEGKYSAEIYTDVPELANSVKKEIRDVSHESKVTVRLEQGGGMVMHLKKK